MANRHVVRQRIEEAVYALDRAIEALEVAPTEEDLSSVAYLSHVTGQLDRWLQENPEDAGQV